MLEKTTAVIKLLLLASATNIVWNISDDIDRKNNVNRIQSAPVPVKPGRIRPTDVREREQWYSDCLAYWGSYCPYGYPDPPVPPDAASVESPARGNSAPVPGLDKRKVRVRPAPRVIDLGGPVELHREHSSCVDDYGSVFCEAEYPQVNFDDR